MNTFPDGKLQTLGFPRDLIFDGSFYMFMNGLEEEGCIESPGSGRGEWFFWGGC